MMEILKNSRKAKYLLIYLLTILIVLQINICQSLDNDEKSEISSGKKVFVPSKEWKEIGDDEQIPAGLHVRINLETGKKEAKFLDKEEQTETNSLIATDATNQRETDQIQNDRQDQHLKEVLMKENILEALKNIKSEDKKNVEELMQEAKERKKLFRSYDEIKSEFEDLNMNIATDTELMQKLMEEYKTTVEEQHKLNILEDLDYLVHQVDNAVNFVTIGGIKNIIEPGLNSTSVLVKKSVMQLLGSASQSNPSVQVVAFEEGLLNHLLRIVARETDASISSKAVFAVSCLVRGFPYGQQRLVESGGLHTLREVFLKQDWHSMSLQLKVVSLVQDLLLERVNAEGDRAEQLNQINLLESLKEGEWCPAISSLLAAASFDKRGKRLDMGSALGKGIPIRPDHDMVDKVIGAMASLVDSCLVNFTSDLPLLTSLEETYEDLAYKEKFQGEDGHVFFQEVANQIRYLVSRLRIKQEL